MNVLFRFHGRGHGFQRNESLCTLHLGLVSHENDVGVRAALEVHSMIAGSVNLQLGLSRSPETTEMAIVGYATHDSGFGCLDSIRI